MKFQNGQIYADRTQIMGCLGLEVRGGKKGDEEAILNDRGFLSDIWKCSKSIVGMAAYTCEYVYNHWTVHFKWLNCLVYELCLNTSVFLKKFKVHILCHFFQNVFKY